MHDDLCNQNHVQRGGVNTCFVEIINIENACRKTERQGQAVKDLQWRNNINSQGKNHIIGSRQEICRACKIEQQEKQNHEAQPCHHEAIISVYVDRFADRDQNQNGEKSESPAVKHHP